MNKEREFEKLLERFFNNANNPKIYHLNNSHEMKILFREMLKVIEGKLNSPLLLQDDVEDLKHFIAGIQTQEDIDLAVEKLEGLLPHCRRFGPNYFNISELLEKKGI